MRVVLDWFSCRKLLLPRHVQVSRSLLGQLVREIPSGVGKKARVERWREAGWGGESHMQEKVGSPRASRLTVSRGRLEPRTVAFRVSTEDKCLAA